MCGFKSRLWHHSIPESISDCRNEIDALVRFVPAFSPTAQVTILLFPMKSPCLSATVQKNNTDGVRQLIFWNKGPTQIGKTDASVMEGPNTYAHGSLPSVAIAGQCHEKMASNFTTSIGLEGYEAQTSPLPCMLSDD